MRRIGIIVGVLGLASFLTAKPLPRLDPASPMDSKTPHVVMETNHGRIVIELYPEKAPLTVKNFLQYVDDGYYNGTIFHRVIPDFVIQGGGMLPGLKEKAGRPPIKNEAGNGLSNERGTLAAARTNNPDSATSQFYINLKHNVFIDRANAPDKVGYCVFGKVVAGMDVVDRICQVNTGNQGGHSNVPVQDVMIVSVRRGTK